MYNAIQQSRFHSAIWLILVVLTLLTYGIGETVMASWQVMLGLLFIAILKGQMVANYFMGLRHVAPWLRAIVLFYFLLIGGFIALAYLIGLQ
ncbi:MAG: cytochrome C oxidase subunit IV family protein [Nitrosomonadales bacterium]|nr:cytochrome C oxidase subunit IV family protein [Nitrosomonadales bacterium]